MAQYRRPLHQTEVGALGANEDSWDLVYDDVACQLYVEHRWHHRLPLTKKGTQRIELSEFLKKSGCAVTMLQSILQELFPAERFSGASAHSAVQRHT